MGTSLKNRAIKRLTFCKPLSCMGWLMGFEPTTTGITIRDSTAELQPPYGMKGCYTVFKLGRSPLRRSGGVPDRNRTCNPQLRRLVLYPVELRARLKSDSPRISMVGVERFELPTSWSQTRRATRLRYTPEGVIIYLCMSHGQFKVSPEHLSVD